MKRYIQGNPILQRLNELFSEFIGWKWFAAFLIIPTLIFICDINIEYFWLILYYISFISIVAIGFIQFVKKPYGNFKEKNTNQESNFFNSKNFRIFVLLKR